MFIQSVEVENFRGLPKFSMNFHERLNVFIGNNGIGKSSILDFLLIMLSQCRPLVRDSIGAKSSDIRNEKKYFLLH